MSHREKHLLIALFLSDYWLYTLKIVEIVFGRSSLAPLTLGLKFTGILSCKGISVFDELSVLIMESCLILSHEGICGKG